jgi:hypothetical protein
MTERGGGRVSGGDLPRYNLTDDRRRRDRFCQDSLPGSRKLGLGRCSWAGDNSRRCLQMGRLLCHTLTLDNPQSWGGVTLSSAA